MSLSICPLMGRDQVVRGLMYYLTLEIETPSGPLEHSAMVLADPFDGQLHVISVTAT